MLRRWDWFSRSKFSFLWNKIYSIYLRITNSPSVIYRVEEEEGGTTNEKHHLIDIHWIYITEPPPSLPEWLQLRLCTTNSTNTSTEGAYVIFLFVPSKPKNSCSQSVLFRQDLTVHPSTVWACAVQFIKKKKEVYFTCSLNVPHLSITPKLTK